MVNSCDNILIILYKIFVGTKNERSLCFETLYKMSSTVTPVEDPKVLEELEGKSKLRKWLNMNFKIEMTDGRVLIGVFLCTDRDANVILGACSEYLQSADGVTEEPRVLGLVMVPGRHIVSIQLDNTTPPQKYFYDE